ncbi:MAG: queuosine precursor transporter [Pseudomonadota bacterium]
MKIFSIEFAKLAALPVAAFSLVVLASNILVQYPVRALHLDEVLTYGAFSYPFAFLVTDITNRRFGAPLTRRIIGCGFVVAVILSLYFATPRIAAASGLAFFLANLLDVQIFERLRDKAWWLPPLGSSIMSSALDTVLFFSIAFMGDAMMSAPVGLFGTTVPLWVKLGVFDYLIKLAMAGLMIFPYAATLPFLRAAKNAVH